MNSQLAITAACSIVALLSCDSGPPPRGPASGAPDAPAMALPPAPPAPATTSSPASAPNGPRPAQWAQPLSRTGLPNLHRVSSGYYRGAQPTAEGFAELAAMNVRTVINLRSLHSDRRRIGNLPLDYEHISMNAWHAEDEDVVAFLRLATDPDRQPVFVHCQHGADRTGVMTAVYRVAVQGWSKQQAIDEMTDGGFGYHVVWKNLISYLEQLDVPRIKREAGLP